MNKNTEFLSGKGFFVFYVLTLIGARTVIYFFTSLVSQKWGQYPTTTTHIIHSIVRRKPHSRGALNNWDRRRLEAISCSMSLSHALLRLETLCYITYMYPRFILSYFSYLCVCALLLPLSSLSRVSLADSVLDALG